MKTRLDNVKFTDACLTEDYSNDDIVTGLCQTPKTLSPKYFYDEKGSQLFDQICELPEYYITRTEKAILKAIAKDISDVIGGPAILYEMGSGSSDKIRILLDEIKPLTYVPVDISKDHLLKSALALGNEYPWLAIHAICVDYSQAWSIPVKLANARKVAFFPGSSIGNFDPQHAQVLLSQIARLLGQGGLLIIGVDRKKDKHIMENAYNDRAGITAAFNLNLLNHINQLMNSHFDIDAFSHHAFFNDDLNRIEMHLESQREQSVLVGQTMIHFDKHETIHTESSYKYTSESFAAIANEAGFTVEQTYTDAENLFCVHLCEVQ